MACADGLELPLGVPREAQHPVLLDTAGIVRNFFNI